MCMKMKWIYAMYSPCSRKIIFKSFLWVNRWVGFTLQPFIYLKWWNDGLILLLSMWNLDVVIVYVWDSSHSSETCYKMQNYLIDTQLPIVLDNLLCKTHTTKIPCGSETMYKETDMTRMGKIKKNTLNKL